MIFDDSLATEADESDVAIFGLSGNPPTGESGHAGIVKYLVHSGRFREIWVLPVYRHQFSAKTALAPFTDRVELCKLAFEAYSSEICQVRVLAAEREVEREVASHGTVDTLAFIHSRCPRARLHLVLGTDTYRDLASGRWKRGCDLFQLATVHVIERLNTPHYSSTTGALPPSLLSQVRHHQVAWLSSLSSSQLRGVNPWPLWPLPFSSPFLTDANTVLPSVLRRLRDRRLYFFSPASLRAVQRSRLACLGLAMAGLACHFLRGRVGMR